MLLRLNEIRGRMADQGRSLSLQMIAEGTGISRQTLTEMCKGRLKTYRPEYVDALCAFLGVSAGELVQAEPIRLPLQLRIRPDRRGARVGEKTNAGGK